MIRLKWAKLADVALFVLGLLPYVALSFVVVKMWDKYLGISVPHLLDTLVFSAKNILGCLALFGSWAFWYILCKLLRNVWWIEL